MITTNLIPIKEQLDRIEKKIDGKHSNPYLSIKQVSNFTSLSTSTIRRALRKGVLKSSRNSGKLLFLESDVKRWLNG